MERLDFTAKAQRPLRNAERTGRGFEMWLRRPAAVYCQSVSLLVAHGLPHDGAIKHYLDRGHYFRDILRVLVMLFDNSSPSSVKRAAAFRTLMAVIWGIRDLFRVGEKRVKDFQPDLIAGSQVTCFAPPA